MAYWPNLHYFYYVLHSEIVLIEQHEHYQKQSYRNRTRILSANGALDLSIPVLKKAPKELSRDVEISYQEAWQMKHWRAIVSAYSNSPYFEHFESEIFPFYSQRYASLLELNLTQLETLLKLLKVKKDIQLTEGYHKIVGNVTDLRELIHPKKQPDHSDPAYSKLSQPYYQTFESKFEFVPNLSILDLLFNEGLQTLDYLGSKGRD